MMRKNLLRGFGLVGCLTLALVWAMLALSGGALADPPPHNHGGGGDEEETIFFDVTTLDGSDIEIIGVFTNDPDAATLETSTGCLVIEGPAAGRSGLHRAVVSQPSPAIQMDFMFLAEGPDGESCFTVGDIYGLTCGGLLSIRRKNNGAESIEYFFEAEGTDGEVRQYRVYGDAMIMADNGGSFPTGDSGYTVFVHNLRVSRNTGSGRTACEGSFPDAVAEIRLDRIIP